MELNRSISSLDTINFEEKVNMIIEKLDTNVKSMRKHTKLIVPIVVRYLLNFNSNIIDNNIYTIGIMNHLQSQGLINKGNIDAIQSMIKYCVFQLHMDKILELNYEIIEYYAGNSDILYRFYENYLGVDLDRKSHPNIKYKLLVPIMIKNRLLNANDIAVEMIEEFKTYSIECDSKVTKYNYVTRVSELFNLHTNLFLEGFIGTQPVYRKLLISNEDYFKDIEESTLKDAILWYLKYNPLKEKVKVSYRIYFMNFILFIQNNCPNVPMNKYNYYIADSYKNHLKQQIANNEISSKNFAYLCLSKVNNLFNFLLDSDFKDCPKIKNLLMPNIFEDRENRLVSKRDIIPQNIVSEILKRAREIGEYEWALMKIYEGTGMRVNELSVFKMEDFHKNAAELIDTSDLDIREDICWIKVTSPKIKDKERIVLIDEETYSAFEILKRIREEKFGDVPPMINPANPQLGKNNYLLLNRFGLPYKSLLDVVTNIIKNIDLKDEQRNKINIQTHQFRHTYLTNLMRHGCPIHLAMHFMGHTDPAMTSYYNHYQEDVQDITYKESLVEKDFKVEVEYNHNKEYIHSDIINELHNINHKYIKRGGYCLQDEFQEDCCNIDCIECPYHLFKTNFTFSEELKKSMIGYFKEWSSQEIETSDRSIHLLYLSKLYETLYNKTMENPNLTEVILNKEEKEQIGKEVGLI